VPKLPQQTPCQTGADFFFFFFSEYPLDNADDRSIMVAYSGENDNA